MRSGDTKYNTKLMRYYEILYKKWAVFLNLGAGVRIYLALPTKKY